MLATLLVVAAASAAWAHVHATTEDDPDPGTVATVAFEFDHGCDGAPTDEFVVRLPDGIPGAEPLEEDGWQAAVGDGVITWSGGEPIPDHELHAFRAEVLLPDRPGETIHFPTIQRCGDDEVAWIQIPGDDEEWGGLDRPAPELVLTDRPAPGEPDRQPLDDETPPPPPADADEEPTMEPVATPVDDAEDTGLSPVVVGALLALVASVAAAVAVSRRRSGAAGPDEPTGDGA